MVRVVRKLEGAGPARGLTLLAVIGMLLTVGACASSREQDVPKTAEPKAAAQEQAQTGPSEQERASAVRKAEQQVAQLREQVSKLRERAELDGVAGEAAIEQGIASAEQKLAEVQQAAAGLKQAGAETWSEASARAERAVAEIQRGLEQAQGQIRSVREAKRVDRIAELQPMLQKGLIKGLDDDVYHAYKPRVIEQVQERLADVGLYDGPIDGYLEETTQRALARFQTDNGIWPTGIPTPKTRRALMGGGGEQESAS